MVKRTIQTTPGLHRQGTDTMPMPRTGRRPFTLPPRHSHGRHHRDYRDAHRTTLIGAPTGARATAAVLRSARLPHEGTATGTLTVVDTGTGAGSGTGAGTGTGTRPRASTRETSHDIVRRRRRRRQRISIGRLPVRALLELGEPVGPGVGWQCGRLIVAATVTVAVLALSPGPAWTHLSHHCQYQPGTSLSHRVAGGLGLPMCPRPLGLIPVLGVAAQSTGAGTTGSAAAAEQPSTGLFANLPTAALIFVFLGAFAALGVCCALGRRYCLAGKSAAVYVAATNVADHPRFEDAADDTQRLMLARFRKRFPVEVAPVSLADQHGDAPVQLGHLLYADVPCVGAVLADPDSGVVQFRATRPDGYEAPEASSTTHELVASAQCVQATRPLGARRPLRLHETAYYEVALSEVSSVGPHDRRRGYTLSVGWATRPAPPFMLPGTFDHSIALGSDGCVHTEVDTHDDGRGYGHRDTGRGVGADADAGHGGAGTGERRGSVGAGHGAAGVSAHPPGTQVCRPLVAGDVVGCGMERVLVSHPNVYVPDSEVGGGSESEAGFRGAQSAVVFWFSLNGKRLKKHHALPGCTVLMHTRGGLGPGGGADDDSLGGREDAGLGGDDVEHWRASHGGGGSSSGSGSGSIGRRALGLGCAYPVLGASGDAEVEVAFGPGFFVPPVTGTGQDTSTV